MTGGQAPPIGQPGFIYYLLSMCVWWSLALNLVSPDVIVRLPPMVAARDGRGNPMLPSDGCKSSTRVSQFEFQHTYRTNKKSWATPQERSTTTLREPSPFMSSTTRMHFATPPLRHGSFLQGKSPTLKLRLGLDCGDRSQEQRKPLCPGKRARGRGVNDPEGW